MAQNPIDIYVGSRLKERRGLLGLSQSKLGNMTGVTFQQIQKYEKGTNRIGSSRLYEFSRILNVPVAFFFDGYDDALDSVSDNRVAFKANKVGNKEIFNLVKYFSSIKDIEVRKSVIALAKSLAKKANEEDE